MKEKLLLAAAALLGFATACNNEEDQPKVVSMYGVPYNNYKIKGKVTDKAGRPIKGIEVRSNAYLPTPEATTAADGTYDLSPDQHVSRDGKTHPANAQTSLALHPAFTIFTEHRMRLGNAQTSLALRSTFTIFAGWIHSITTSNS